MGVACDAIGPMGVACDTILYARRARPCLLCDHANPCHGACSDRSIIRLQFALEFFFKLGLSRLDHGRFQPPHREK